MAEHCKISVALVAVHEERSYVLKVDRYSRVKGILRTGECVASAPFSVGGHSWAVEYYPNGRHHGSSADCGALYLLLQSVAGAQEGVKAKFTLSVLDEHGDPSLRRSISTHTFTSKHPGYHVLFLKARLEGSVHPRDDCLVITCEITVTKEIHGEERLVTVPPSDLHRHLGELLMKGEDTADVTFQVGGQRFSAHRCVLAARSSVFKAELLGAMQESSSHLIEIGDMEPDVFRCLLGFIYTDSVPPALDADARDAGLVMAGHLLVAADRYDIRRLKLICEEKLCSHIDSDMVATSLALAEQHGFPALKEACFKFMAASPSNVEAMMASDGFEHLKSSCPSVLKELITRILPPQLKAANDLIMEIW